jgi:NADH:ubiquinone oxidoreductase subunit 4 (subunit M)
MLLTLIVFLPALCALIVLLWPNRWIGAVKPVAATGALVVFALSLWLYLGLLIPGKSFAG